MVAYCIAMYSAFQQSGCRVGSMCPISTPHPNEREWEQASRYSVAQPPPTAPRRMPQQAPGPAPLPRGVRGRAAARVLRQRRRGRVAGGRDARRRRGLEWVVHAANGLRRQREAQRLGDGGAGARRGHRAQAQAPGAPAAAAAGSASRSASPARGAPAAPARSPCFGHRRLCEAVSALAMLTLPLAPAKQSCSSSARSAVYSHFPHRLRTDPERRTAATVQLGTPRQ